MVKRIPILLGLLLLASACHAQTRWCNSIKALPEDKLIYPPIARAARVMGRVISRVTVTSAGTIRDIETISGYPMLAAAVNDQFKEWKVASDATAESSCLGLIIVDFAFEGYEESLGVRPGDSSNIVYVPIVIAPPVIDVTISDPAPLKRHRWHW